jgi:hypothetical protein
MYKLLYFTEKALLRRKFKARSTAIKRPEREADYPLSSCAEGNNTLLYLPSPIHLHGIMLKQRADFALPYGQM